MLLNAYSAPRPTAGSSISTSEATGTRRFSDTCAAASGSTRSKAAAKMTRVEDRNSVPTQPKNHRLISSSKMTWNAALFTTQPASITGYGKIGRAAFRAPIQRVEVLVEAPAEGLGEQQQEHDGQATVVHRPANMPVNTRRKSLAPRISPYRVVPQFGHSR